MTPIKSVPFLILGSLSLLNAQEFRSFVGENNTLWESPGNWDPNLVPDSITEGARLDTGATVVLGSDKFISALEITGSGGISLSLDSHLTTSTLVWDIGGLTGPGTLRVTQAGTINANAGASIASSTFTNDGAINLGNSLILSAGATINNNHTIELVDSATIGTVLGSGPAVGIINNTGFLRKSNGPGSATIGSYINNENGISCDSGTFIISQGGISSGNFVTGPGATLDLNGDWVLEDGASIFGDGVTEVGSTLAIEPNSTVSLDNVHLNSSGSIAGAGTALLQGIDHNWTNSASLGGASTTIISSGAVANVFTTSTPFAITGTAELVIAPGGTLNLNGSQTRLNSDGNGTIRNQGLIDITNSGDFTQNGIDPSTLLTLINEPGGTIRKSGTEGSNPTFFVFDFVSEGTIDVREGEIQTARGGTISGPIEISSGASFRINSNTVPFTLAQGASINGEGVFIHAGSNIVVPAGALVPVANYTTLFSGGAITGEGTFRFSTDSLVERLHSSGIGITHIPAGITISGVERLDLDEGRTLRVDGTLDIISTLSSTSTNGATIDNSGTISFSGATGIGHGGGVFAINNTGHLRFLAPGTGSVNLPADQFTGNGLTTIESGRLNLTRPVTTNGTIEIFASGELRGSNLTVGPDSIVKGSGTINGNTTISGSLQPGLSIGTLTHSGSPTFTNTGALEIELGDGSSDLYDVSSNLDLGDARLILSLDPGYLPTPGATWTIAEASNITGSFSAVEQPVTTPGFGFFLTQTNQEITISYSAIDTFQKVYAAYSGTDGNGPGIAAFANEDLDNDGVRNLLEWAYGGNLTGSDPGRILSLLSVAPGDPSEFTLRYPLNPLATDVTLTMESSPTLNGVYNPVTMTSVGTVTENGIEFQIVTVSLPRSASNYFRLRATRTP